MSGVFLSVLVSALSKSTVCSEINIDLIFVFAKSTFFLQLLSCLITIFCKIYTTYYYFLYFQVRNWTAGKKRLTVFIQLKMQKGKSPLSFKRIPIAAKNVFILLFIDNSISNISCASNRPDLKFGGYIFYFLGTQF